MANRWYTQFYGSLHKKPVQLDCNFVVDPANGNGLGIRNLKGPGIANVFMHTTASFTGNTHTTNVIDGISGGTGSLLPLMPISGSGIPTGTVIASITSSSAIVISNAATSTVSGDVISYAGVGSTNPGAGYIMVQFQDNFNRYFFGTSGFVSPLTGTPISISGAAVMTIGNPYVIVSVGTSTQANWNAAGLPAGIIPAVGEPFFAAVTGGATGTGIVEAPSNSGIMSIEVVGDPNQTLGANFNGASFLGGGTAGSYMILQCLNPSDAPTAPVSGSVVGLSFFLSNSYITVQGE